MTTERKSKVNEDAIIRIYQSNGQLLKQVAARKGLNLWYVLRREGIPIGSACTGVGVCGACAVQLTISADAPELEAPSELESRTRKQNGIAETFRIACLVRVFGNLDVTLRP